MNTDTISGPSHWAPYLINGDTSGMTAAELDACRAYFRGHTVPVASVLSDVEDSARFTWSYRLYGGTTSGGEVCDYIVSLARTTPAR